MLHLFLLALPGLSHGLTPRGGWVESQKAQNCNDACSQKQGKCDFSNAPAIDDDHSMKCLGQKMPYGFWSGVKDCRTTKLSANSPVFTGCQGSPKFAFGQGINKELVYDKSGAMPDCSYTPVGEERRLCYCEPDTFPFVLGSMDFSSCQKSGYTYASIAATTTAATTTVSTTTIRTTTTRATTTAAATTVPTTTIRTSTTRATTTAAATTVPTTTIRTTTTRAKAGGSNAAQGHSTNGHAVSGSNAAQAGGSNAAQGQSTNGHAGSSKTAIGVGVGVGVGVPLVLGLGLGIGFGVNATSTFPPGAWQAKFEHLEPVLPKAYGLDESSLYGVAALLVVLFGTILTFAVRRRQAAERAFTTTGDAEMLLSETIEGQ